MADIYKPVINYINTGVQQSEGTGGGQGNEVDEYISSLPQEEREAAIKRLSAPPSVKEIAESAQASGRPPTMDEFRAIREYNKTKEVPVIEAIGSGFSGVMNDLANAMGSTWNDPVHALKTAPANVVEGFAQGTRNFYGMLSQSADPTSSLFRLKSVIGGTDSDAEQYRQYMDAWNFNKHSEDLISGKTTVVMDKGMIDPHMVQAMSYVLDPTLFIPFGEVASGGIKAIGMGEKLAMLSAKSAAIKSAVLGGALKWGVGAPIEFMGSAVRNTIDYGIERGAAGFEAVSGIPAKEVQATARMSGLGTSAASVGGYSIPYASDIANAMVGSRAAQGIGEAISTVGDQIMKQKGNRGILSYAGQALADTEKVGGVQLSNHAKRLLQIVDAVDPMFGFANEITKGAAHGAMIGGALGYASGGKEGMAHGIGAGIALGAVGGGAGKIVNEVSNVGLYDRTAIQRKMTIEGLKGIDDTKAMAFSAMVKTAEATGNRHYMAEVDGIISAWDKVAPNSKLVVRSDEDFKQFIKDNKIDPATGRLIEKSQIFPEIKSRQMTADALGILRDNGDQFLGNSKKFLETIQTDKKFTRQRKAFEALDETGKKAVLDSIDNNADASFRSSLKGMSIKDYYGHLNYAERLADTVNKIATNTSEEAGRAKINEFLKSETVKGQLTRRGKMLKDKLASDGWFDKDGKMLTKRDTQGEATLAKFQGSAGFVFRRDATGQVEIHLNTSALGDTTIPHELFHAVMMDSVLKPDFMDRWVQRLIGKYDQNGKMLEAGSAHINEVKTFFEKYIESENRGDAEAIRIKKEELQKSLDEYQSRGKNERISDKTVVPLEHYAEEFGAYYFQKWLRGKPVDYLFRGGDLGGIRGLLETAKGSWLDFWQAKMSAQNPSFDFNNIKDFKISQAFEKNGKRVRISAFDLFMQDFVRANANLNKESGFDLSRLSNEAQAQFINANGIRGYGKTDNTGRVVRYNQRKAIAEEIRIGKEVFKILNSLDPALRKGGTTTDGEGNISGRPNTAEIDAIVKSGLVPRAWVDKVIRGYDIVDGNGGNLIYFGYLGRTAQIGDYAWPRLVGSDVPFKNRAAILFGVDFKVGADGKMHSLFHTLDKAVIDARGNNLWKDANIRDLWDGDRASMEADFFKYLSNASKSSQDKSRRPSHLLLERGDGLGAQRRNALHQMLGMAKGENEVYINKPTSEIPYGIRQSVTTFNVDGISNLRVDNGVRYDYKDVNAGKDLSRNFMPSEMKQEDTPSGGKIIKHATGYQISKQAGTKFKVFDPEGKHLGDFDTVADAGRAAQKHFNESYDKSVEGKDKPVPNTEIPPSRVEYKDKRVQKILDDNKIEQAVIEALEKEISGITSKENYPESAANYYARPFRDAIEAIKRDGLIKAVSNEDASHVKILQLQQIKPDVSSLGDIDIGIPHYAKELKVSYLLDKLTKLAQHEYDSMYPMEIKSALHGQLAQIFQDYPQITAKALIGKIQKYGSLDKARLMQEATEIGLIDLLKSKPMATKVKKEIYRAYDRTTESFTGEVKVKETPVQYEPFVDIKEILDFAKSKEIRVTIEEGARERIGIDTSQYTLGGAKDNYKQTAIRINPEYAHGILGHYGKDTIVHFRTTERIDADGNRHLFIEEVQANNTDKKANGTDAEIRKLERDKKVLPVLETIKQEGIKRGIYVNDPFYVNPVEGQQPTLVSAIRAFLQQAERESDTGALLSLFKSRRADYEQILKTAGFDGDIEVEVINLFVDNYLHRALTRYYESVKSDYDFIRTQEDVNASDAISGLILDEGAFRRRKERIEKALERIENLRDKVVLQFQGEFLKGRPISAESKLPLAVDAILSVPELKKYFEYARDIAKRTSEFEKYLIDSSTSEHSGFAIYSMNPHHLEANISDIKTRIQQAKAFVKPLPLTSAKDWSLTALKGIIRQGIRDGLDKITLTHPDDSPTVSHMKGDARKGLYGKLIPEVWGSWLRKYGIEMKQTNKLADATIDTAKGQMAEITNKLHDANKAVLEHFEQVKGGEDPTTINNLAQLMASPVHEVGRDIDSVIQKASEGINDTKLKALINEVGLLKGGEKYHYEHINELREKGIRGTSKVSSTDAGISAEAIDRGYTFELNDRIKREFLEGRINTHSMPSEEGATQGGRTYTDAQFKNEFIGKVAAENPERIKNLNIKVLGKKDSFEFYIYDKNSPSNDAIGYIHTINKSGNNKDNIITQAFLKPEYRGKGYGKLLYSELGERLRSVGIENIEGTVTDLQNRPFAIRASVFGSDSTSRMAGTKDGVTTRLDPNARYQPSEEDAYQGGRTYDFNSKQFKAGFLGLYAEQNPDRVKGVSLQFMKRADGSHRIRLTDNSKKGESADIGHIIANISGDTATLSSHINEDYRGKKLAYVVYSEMAERLRAMGIKSVDGQIVNPDGVPVYVREQIIGDTRDYNTGKPIGINEAAARIQARQKDVGSMGGVDVYNKLYKQGRYMPSEDGSDSVKTKNKITLDVNGLLSKLGMNLKDKTKMEIWMRHLTDDHATALEFIREEGLVGWMKNRAQSVIDAEVESWDAGYKELKHQQKVAQQFLDKVENGNIDITKFQPAEGEQGGRTYSNDQFNKDFIGKFAEENPDITNKFIIRIKQNDGGTMEEWDYKMVIYDKETKKAVARTKWELFENDDGILEDAASDVEILDQAYKGMKLSHLMQSERLERSRFLGAEKVRSQITNEEGIPIKNYAKTIGADKGEITSSFAERYDEDGVTKYIPATMENFKQEMDLSKAHADNTWKPTVYYRADLDSKGRYQPAEYSEFKSEQSATGRILRNAKGYVIMLANNKFRVYNPAKAIIGVYGSEEEAKKRIYKEIPKR